MIAKKRGAPLAYQTWAVARVAQEIRRLRPAVKRPAAAAAALRYMSELFESEGERPMPIEFLPRVTKALQTLENRKAEVSAFAFFDAWHIANGKTSPTTEAAEEAIRTYLDP